VIKDVDNTRRLDDFFLTSENTQMLVHCRLSVDILFEYYDIGACGDVSTVEVGALKTREWKTRELNV